MSKLKTTIQNLKVFLFLLPFTFYLLPFLCGCATLQEGARGIAGISTKALEDNRKSALTRTFNYDYDSCYNEVKTILTHIGAYIYAEDLKKQMVAIYVSEEDTTPVGLFFKEMDGTHTQLEVVSPSTYAKEFIAARLFFALDKSLTPEEEEGVLEKSVTPEPPIVQIEQTLEETAVSEENQGQP